MSDRETLGYVRGQRVAVLKSPPSGYRDGALAMLNDLEEYLEEVLELEEA